MCGTTAGTQSFGYSVTVFDPALPGADYVPTHRPRDKPALCQRKQSLHLRPLRQSQHHRLPMAGRASHQRQFGRQCIQRLDQFHHFSHPDLPDHHQSARRFGQMFSSMPHQPGAATPAIHRNLVSLQQHHPKLPEPPGLRHHQRSGPCANLHQWRPVDGPLHRKPERTAPAKPPSSPTACLSPITPAKSPPSASIMIISAANTIPRYPPTLAGASRTSCITNAGRLINFSTNATASTNFDFVPAKTGTWVMEAQGVIFNQFGLEWSPAKPTCSRHQPRAHAHFIGLSCPYRWYKHKFHLLSSKAPPPPSNSSKPPKSPAPGPPTPRPP